MKQIGSQKKLKKKFTIRRPHLSIGGGSAGLVKDHTLTFFFWDPSLRVLFWVTTLLHFLDPSLTKETEGSQAFLYFHKEFLALSQNIVFYV